MNDLSPRARALFEQARAAEQPAHGAQARVAQRLASRLAAGAALGAGAATAKSASAVWAPMLKTMTWVSAGTAVSLAAWHEVAPRLRSTRSAQDPPVVMAALPSAPDNPAPNLSASGGQLGRPGLGVTGNEPVVLALPEEPASASRGAPASQPALPSAAAALEPRAPATANFPQNPADSSPVPRAESLLLQPPAATPSPKTTPKTEAEAVGTPTHAGNSQPTAESIAAEAESLRAVQRAMRDGQPARALEVLDRDDSRFARGALAQERSAARVQALCKLGRKQHAHEEVLRFERRFPSSVLLERVRAQCP